MKAGVSGGLCDFPSFDAVLFPTEKESTVARTEVHRAACSRFKKRGAAFVEFSLSGLIQCDNTVRGIAIRERDARGSARRHTLLLIWSQ